MKNVDPHIAVRHGGAFHEAGHAIVLWSFDIKVLGLYVNDNGDGEVTAHSPNHLSNLDQIVIAMAGWAGADFGDCPHSSLDCEKLTSDRVKAERIASNVLGTEDIDANEADIRTLLVEGRDKARQIIEKHRAKFEETAERLFAGGELLADEIAILLPSIKAL
jgi:hypothetical protein